MAESPKILELDLFVTKTGSAPPDVELDHNAENTDDAAVLLGHALGKLKTKVMTIALSLSPAQCEAFIANVRKADQTDTLRDELRKRRAENAKAN